VDIQDLSAEEAKEEKGEEGRLGSHAKSELKAIKKVGELDKAAESA